MTASRSSQVTTGFPTFGGVTTQTGGEDFGPIEVGRTHHHQFRIRELPEPGT